MGKIIKINHKCSASANFAIFTTLPTNSSYPLNRKLGSEE